MTRGEEKRGALFEPCAFSREKSSPRACVNGKRHRDVVRSAFSEPDGSCSSFGHVFGNASSEARRHAARRRRARDASWRLRRSRERANAGSAHRGFSLRGPHVAVEISRSSSPIFASVRRSRTVDAGEGSPPRADRSRTARRRLPIPVPVRPRTRCASRPSLSRRVPRPRGRGRATPGAPGRRRRGPPPGFGRAPSSPSTPRRSRSSARAGVRRGGRRRRRGTSAPRSALCASCRRRARPTGEPRFCVRKTPARATKTKAPPSAIFKTARASTRFPGAGFHFPRAFGERGERGEFRGLRGLRRERGHVR